MPNPAIQSRSEFQRAFPSLPVLPLEPVPLDWSTYRFDKKFGAGTLGITQTETDPLWSGAGVHPGTQVQDAIMIEATDAEDDVGGVGARVIKFWGTDENFNEVVGTAPTAGAGVPVNTGRAGVMVHRAQVVRSGSKLQNSGDINFSIGGTDVALLSAFEGQTLIAYQPVFSGWHGYVLAMNMSATIMSPAKITARLRILTFAESWHTKVTQKVSPDGIPTERPFAVAIPAKEQAIIAIDGVSDKMATQAAADFDFLLVKHAPK